MIRTRRTTVGRELERLLRDGVRSARGDAQLLDRYLGERDEVAFEILVERHGPMVLSLCRRYLHDPRDVEDAFQATFMILVRKGSRLRDAASLSSWLYGVAYRVALRARSDVMKRRRREGEPDGLAQAVAPPVHPADDSLETLDAELSRLPEKYRAPLVLCYLEGRTHEQAAAELGWPVGTVRSRMARARAILEARLTRRGLDASACLAVLRPDCFLTSTVLPSLASASTSWPATALAQGVLATMLFSQLKWIGAATATVGLVAATAGMGAWAVNNPSRPEDDSRPVQESRPTEAKPRPEPSAPPAQPPLDQSLRKPSYDTEARLAEMERKIDRLMDLLHHMEERSAFPVIPGNNLFDPPPGAPGPQPQVSRPAPVAAPTVESQGQAPVAAPPSPRDDRREVLAAEVSPPHALPSPREDSPVALPANRPDGPPQVPPLALPAVDTVPAPSTPEVRPPSPIASSGSTPGEMGTSRTLADLVLSRRERGSLREIEALLHNLYVRQQRNDRLRTQGVLSEADSIVPTELARVLVAQLKEMEDEVEYQDSSVERLHDTIAKMREESARIWDQLEGKSLGDDPKAERLNASRGRMDQAANKMEGELLAESREFERMKSRLPRVRELIRWAGEHFKELKQTDG